MSIRITKIALFSCFLGILLVSCKSKKPIPDQKTAKKMVREEPIAANSGATPSEEYTQEIPETEISFDMVLLPEGSFTMGSPESEADRKPDEGPQKEVSVDAFYMGKYELTWDVF
ncbi:MAG TPA: SUMF1/EgtB/PvdO family nonheme iron enzyme, partial [Pricia sp.]|nr:SUMF1/EgtB/PvdO family nonheme iron enzyme [Pricia sp.]